MMDYKGLYATALNKTNEYGLVEEVRYPICICSGLPDARPQELVYFEDGSMGKIIALTKNAVEILIFSNSKLQVGLKVARSETFLRIPVGFEMLAKVIDPMGNLLFEDTSFKTPVTYLDTEVHPEPISKRARIKKQLVTGVTLIDQLIPLGMGQRELVVGDRKTGKTGTIFTLIKNQVSLGSIIIYAAIGKRNIEIKKLKEDFERAGLFKSICIVAAPSDSSPSLIDQTPYAAMTLADYFKNNKKDVIVIFDDLSTHAKFYREISLIAKRFPGRDSYPGDIFYKHAVLLERAGNYLVDGKEYSITALPVAETMEGELTDYITSNLISITDGHILFDQKSFNKGVRPAVNVFLSVTRVGKQTQNFLGRDITHNLLNFLGKYEKALEFSHFGSELSAQSKIIISIGEKMYKLFEQDTDEVVPLEVQQFLVGVFYKDILTTLKPFQISLIRKQLTKQYLSDDKVKKQIDMFFSVKNFEEFTNLIDKEKENIKILCKI